MAPMTMKAACQPHSAAIHGTLRGASTAPMLAPELKMPVANERSRLGKYSAVALIAAGKLPASPIASSARASMKPATDTGTAAMPTAAITVPSAAPIGMANACEIAPSDQTVMARMKACLVPRRSTTRPANNIEMAYTNWNTAVMLA